MVIITTGLTVAVNTVVMIVQQIYQVVIILITIQISKIYGNKIKFLSIPLLFNLFSALHCAYAILYKIYFICTFKIH